MQTADTSSDLGADSPGGEDAPMNQDAPSVEGPAPDQAPQDGQDALPDTGGDVPDGGPPDTTPDASDGPTFDVPDDVEETGDLVPPSSDGPPTDAPPPDTGPPPDVGPRGDPSHPAALHVFATTDNGGLWLLSSTITSLHGPVGFIYQTVNVRASAGSIGLLEDVEAQSIENEVNAIARQGSDLFATSVVDQTWRPWAKIATGVSTMSLANVAGQLWACLAGSNGRLRLMVRQSVGWQDLGDVMDEASLASTVGEAPTALAKLDCVGVQDDLVIFGLDPNGGLWRATKMPTRWIRFQRKPDASGRSFRDIDVANSWGEIHVLGSSQTTQHHGTFNANDEWSGFGDLGSYLNNPPGDILAGAQVAVGAEVDWLQVTTLGEIWISPRFRAQLNNYDVYSDRAPDDSRFVTVSATSVLPY